MDDKNNINSEEKLIEAGRGVPQDQADNSVDHGSKQTTVEQSDKLDERIRKAGA